MALEVNDFNAVRISLASPDQIRSWSYGEVTKPETINYRTLKPEKDGLFCEKIFGPTKDFECFCGKYKRVRYKGIVCDKCGVEVARSKVRRERMGHIELATPVSHIWFVKGTPSRMGLLLDLSPRSLERVLYFAQYIVTHVDEQAREDALGVLREDLESEEQSRLKPLQDELAELAVGLQRDLDDIGAKRAAQIEQVNREHEERIVAIRAEAAAIEAELSAKAGEKAKKAVRLHDVEIVPAGGEVSAEAVALLRDAVQAATAAAEAELENRRSDVELVASAAAGARQSEHGRDEASLQERLAQTRETLGAEFEKKIEALEGLRPLVLLKDTEYRELQESFGHVFRAGMGASAVLEILQNLDLEALREQLGDEIHSSGGQRRKKATKRLRVVEAFRKSGNQPEWMAFQVLPVLPPDLRPMVQLDGGRFATSDLNDLYRRVINRNNRLKRLLELGAPEIIIRNEKRMLQEAVDSLIDNGRRGRAVSGQGNHRLKSLSDMLKGKQGRFRQNLLGKRVDYSGRSVIVVGPELKLHQCGLPKRMALELFKPFVMHTLVAKGLAHNIKSAKRIVERARPEVWDVLDEVIKERPVLLNRAPTLHRLGIQAFEPVLIEGSAIQLHPLVCSAFNADFDGDQMAVHVPLSREAVAEARQVMLASRNLLLPSSGEPTVTPTLDIVLGCYYLTVIKPGATGEYRPATNGRPAEGVFGSFSEARLAYDLRIVGLQSNILVRDAKTDNRLVETSVGRILFNEVLPEEIGFRNEVMDKKALRAVVADCYKRVRTERTAEIVDAIKDIGFRYATQSGVTIALNDIKVPEAKKALLEQADARIAEIEEQYRSGLMTEQERYDKAVEIWTETTNAVQQAISDTLDRYGSVYMMAQSGAKGNIAQIRQMAGMRGLMSDPSGRIIDLPIRASFREGLPVLEYFISTHGARKGLADTALRTADSGYLTRRLIDVAQEVIILMDDCGSEGGAWIGRAPDRGVHKTMRERMIGRCAAAPIADPKTGEVIVNRNEEINEERAEAIAAAGVERLFVRSPFSCGARRGLCRLCYGRDLARSEVVKIGEAVGIIAAQSIGEPGTQLTMRTFHTGGVAGLDITSGLPRVEELFEARVPKVQAVISEIDGVVEVLREGDARTVRVTRTDTYRDEYDLPEGYALAVKPGKGIDSGDVLAAPKPKRRRKKDAEEEPGQEVGPATIVARVTGQVVKEGDRVAILYEESDTREHQIAAAARLSGEVETGAYVAAGQQLTEGYVNPQDILRVKGRESVQQYLVQEVQRVYEMQGVNINDKHIEVIVRQMLGKVRIDAPGDTTMLPGELVDHFEYEDMNARVLAEGGEPATAETVLLGVTKASLNTDSFLAAASFMETTRVLTEAAVSGAVDHLLGLKENVIIGKLIPARAQIELPPRREKPPRPFPLMADDVEELEELVGSGEGVFVLEEGLGHREADLEPEIAEDEVVLAVEPKPVGYVARPDDDD